MLGALRFQDSYCLLPVPRLCPWSRSLCNEQFAGIEQRHDTSSMMVHDHGAGLLEGTPSTSTSLTKAPSSQLSVRAGTYLHSSHISKGDVTTTFKGEVEGKTYNNRGSPKASMTLLPDPSSCAQSSMPCRASLPPNAVAEESQLTPKQRLQLSRRGVQVPRNGWRCDGEQERKHRSLHTLISSHHIFKCSQGQLHGHHPALAKVVQSMG